MKHQSSESLVSIVIPCYNAERFIGETLRSVAAQRGIDFEVIVIDDGSTDRSRNAIEAMRPFFGPAIQTHYGTNRGVSAARNTGTTYARGEYIQYLDSDDLLEPDSLRQRLEALASGAEVAYSNWQKLVEIEPGVFTRGEVVSRCIEDIHEDPQIALFTNFWCPPAAMLYRRSIVEAIGGWNEALPVIQDAQFALDAALCGASFVHVPNIGALYRVPLQPGLSRRDPTRFLLDCLTQAENLDARWIANGTLDNERRRALANAYRNTTYGLVARDEAGFRRSLRGLRQHRTTADCTKAELLGVCCACIGYRATVALLRTIRNVKRRLEPARRRRLQ